MISKPIVMAGGDACKFLGISRQRFGFLVDQYKIPYQQTTAGKIFFKEDLEIFQETRKDKLKHGKKTV